MDIKVAHIPKVQERDVWRLLEREGFLSKRQWKEVLRKSKQDERHFVEILLRDETLPHEKILDGVADLYKTQVVHLRNRVISPFVLNLIPKEVAEQHSVVVFKKIKDVIHVATTNPDNRQVFEFIAKKTGFEPKIFLASPADIQDALRRYQGEIAAEFAAIIENGIRETMAIHDTAEKMAQYVPVIQMVTSIIDRGIQQRASDIHFEPHADRLTIRFRVDGLLHRVVDLPSELHAAIIARLKLLAHLKIDEHRVPQDGRFSYVYRDREIALRVSAVPTLHGMKVVLRILDTKDAQFTLGSLGLNQHDLGVLRREIAKPYGMVLVTGPTGSGKTTTLYALLRLLNKASANICTIEDPIEYGIDGINQTQINPGAGLTFGNGLRSLLRQDPNVIMVGEIRDVDTADIAVNAAMTGHLILSTLHTNSAFLAVQRLTEMGLQPFLTASVVNVIIGQRLVRRVCRSCGKRTASPGKLLERYAHALNLETVIEKLRRANLLPPHFSMQDIPFKVGRGCDRCNETGYRGRVGIYEVMAIDHEIHDAILRDPSAETIKALAVRRGTLTMAEDGILKACTGVTTFEEILRVMKE